MTCRSVRTRVWMPLIALMLAVLWLAATARPALAAGVVGNGTPGSCTDNALAAVLAGGNGTITFNCGAALRTISANTHVISAGQNFVINGNNRIALDGEELRQLFIVANGGTLTLRNLVLTRGGGASGSAVRNAVNGSLTLRGVLVTNSGIDADEGGGIYNAGLLEVELSSFVGNSAHVRGGAIYNAAGATASVRDSLFRGNFTGLLLLPQGDGGAIYNLGALSVTASTLTRNRAARSGGGLYTATGSAAIVNSTIHENVAGAIGEGGGIYAGASAGTSLVNVTVGRNNANHGGGIWNDGNTSIVNTIVAESNNSLDNGPSLNCDGPSVTSGGHNLISDLSCVTNGNPSDLRGVSSMLSFIDSNGGPTDTLMLLVGSPAIDAGDNAACPATDQRGIARPVGPRCDIGAVEFRLVDSNLKGWLPLIVK